MSGPGQRSAGSGWLWNGTIGDWYMRDPRSQQIFLWNCGHPVPASSRPSLDPRHGQHPSPSTVRGTSQPESAGSPSRSGAYSLHGSHSQQPGSSSWDHTRPPPSSLPRYKPSGSSNYSTSPTTGPVSRSRSDSSQPSSGLPSYDISSQPGSSPPTIRYAAGTNPPPPMYGSTTQSLDRAMSDLSTGSASTRNTPSAGQSNTSRYQRRDAYDENSQVHSIIDVETYTDPNRGTVSRPFLRGTDGEEERLYPEFKKRPKPRKFFTVGKVFMILWTEPAGEAGTSNTLITSRQESVRPGRFGELVFSKVRRFIVIRESERYCWALSIVSYGDQGVSKAGTVKSEHGIVYIGKEAPEARSAELPRRGERGMVPDPVRIDPDQRDEKLTDMSRINYGKVYTVEHNVKVRPVGTVSKESLRALIYQFKSIVTPDLSQRHTPSTAPEQGPSTARSNVPVSNQGRYNAALQWLLSQGHSRERAEAILKSQGKASAKEGKEEVEGSEEGSDEHGDEDDASDDNASQRAKIKKLITNMQRYGGFTEQAAIDAIKRERRKSQAQEASDHEQSEEEDSTSEDDAAKATRAQRLQMQRAAQAKKFNDAVAALHQQGVAYEEAYRSVQLSMRRSRSQATASASQSGSTSPRQVVRERQRKAKSSGEPSEEDE